jgi:hypothetical protein
MYSIPGFDSGKLPNFLVYPPIRTTISCRVHYLFVCVACLVHIPFQTQPNFLFISPAKTRPASPLTRTSVVCRKHRAQWKIPTTSQARHAAGSFNPVSMLQTNGMVQPTLPVRKRWKQTQRLVLVTYSHGVPSFPFSAAITVQRLKFGTETPILFILWSQKTLNFPHKKYNNTRNDM